MQEPGRNDPCPCGSGKKYKKCCFLKSQLTGVTEINIQTRLVRDILEFSRKYYRHSIVEAIAFFWEDFNPVEDLDESLQEMADINFWEWFLYDWQPDVDHTKTFLQLYLEKFPQLPADEKRVLEKMSHAVLSLYEVQEVFPEEGLLLKDLVLGEEYHVTEQSATRYLHRWDILAARILNLDGGYILSGSAYTYPLRNKKQIIDYLKHCHTYYKQIDPECTMREFLKRGGDLFNFLWCDIIQDPSRPILVTTTGEPLVLATARFEIRDRNRVIERLNHMKELDAPEEGCYKWLDEEQRDGSATVLGTIEMQQDVLKLVCFSNERLERGKRLLQECLGDSIVHVTDEFHDPSEVVDDLPPRAQQPDSGLPKDQEQQFYAQFMQQHYEQWLNEPLPILKGRTPLETVKRPWGKKKVAELLKTIENHEERNKKNGASWFETGWLWERLGLDH